MSEAFDDLRRRAFSVALMLAAGVGAAVAGGRWALAVAASAVAVLLVIAIHATFLRWDERDCALDVIIAGGERIPVAAIARERRRLLAARTRHQLADGLRGALSDASENGRSCNASVPLDRAVIRAATADLRHVIALLDGEPAAAQGIALAERLVTDGASALYRHDAARLREELRRTSYLLMVDSRADAS